MNEWDIYGAKRIGVLNTSLQVFPRIPTIIDSSALDTSTIAYFEGQRQYELTNHLGNVFATISDRTLPVDTNLDSLADYYQPDIVNAQDYYPFGVLEPGRSYQMAGDSLYHFGFNGKLHDDDIYGNRNSYDYSSRFYDPRLGKWLSIDPLVYKYPYESPYVFSLNSPIQANDPDGKDVIFVNGHRLMHAQDDAGERDKEFQEKLKNTYWNNTNPSFTNDVEKYFNDYTAHYVTASHMRGSDASERQKEGYDIGVKMVTSGEIKVSAENNVMTIVMHSQGNAEGVGIATGIIEAAAKNGQTVTVNLVFLSTHQGADIKMSAEMTKRGIQFTYGNDNGVFVQPMTKIPVVEDANSSNTEWKGSGSAHSATIDDPKEAALNNIKKIDASKHIYAIRHPKPNTPSYNPKHESFR